MSVGSISWFSPMVAGIGGSNTGTGAKSAFSHWAYTRMCLSRPLGKSGTKLVGSLRQGLIRMRSVRRSDSLARTRSRRLPGNGLRRRSRPGRPRQRELNLVKAAGYRSARTTDVGWTDRNSDPFRLKITGVSDDASIHMVVAQLSGIATWLHFAAQGSWNGHSVVADIPAEPDETRS